MKVFLLNTPFIYRAELEYLTQNLGLGYIAASLLQDGHEVVALDALAEGMNRVIRVETAGRAVARFGLSYEEIVDRIPPDADLIGITAPFSNHAFIIDELAPLIKARHPNIPIIVGGVYPSTQPMRAMRCRAVDYVLVGEGESAMRSIAAGKDPATVPGVWRRENGEIIDGGRSILAPDLDDIPFPARHLFPMDKYLTLSPRSRPNLPTATLITSRGCPFDCTFCSIHPVYTHKWRYRSPENVLAEVDHLIEDWGVKFLEFEDDNLTLEGKRAKAIFEGLAERNIHWNCSNGLRVDSLDEEMLRLMKKSRCEAVHLAIESGTPEMLKAMDKKLNLEKVEEIIEICHRIGMPTVVFMIIGHPGETERLFEQSLKFVKRLKKKGMVACGAHIATPYPGTRLFDECKAKGWLINPNAEESIFLPGDVHIETPDFKREDVIRRTFTMRAETGMVEDPTAGLKGFWQWRAQPKLVSWGLSSRVFVGQFEDGEIPGLETKVVMPNGVSFRKTNAEALIPVNIGKWATKLAIFARSNRNHKASALIGETLIGDFDLSREWQEYYLKLPPGIPRGKATLRIVSETSSQFELGEGLSRDPIGLFLSWVDFV